MKRNAIIIAAGTSSRFVPLSFERPKGLIEVKGEVLIERQLRQLHEADISDVTIVVGYMADKFAYLAERYGARLVLNEDYMCYNNTSSLIRILEYLGNTYICCSDQYYEKNPFMPELQESAYATLYAEGITNEYCLDLDENDIIHNVRIGGADDWYMAGYAYFSEEFSNAFREFLKEEYQNEIMRKMYWEDVYIKHIHELPFMRVIKYTNGDLKEFDSLDELRMFDTSYIGDTRSSILKNLCIRLQCKESDLSGFKKIINAEGEAFSFSYKEKNYHYINGEITKC